MSSYRKAIYHDVGNLLHECRLWISSFLNKTWLQFEPVKTDTITAYPLIFKCAVRKNSWPSFICCNRYIVNRCSTIRHSANFAMCQTQSKLVLVYLTENVFLTIFLNFKHGYIRHFLGFHIFFLFRSWTAKFACSEKVCFWQPFVFRHQYDCKIMCFCSVWYNWSNSVIWKSAFLS